METKKKKTLLNTIMVLLILVIAASGVFTVGKIQGWFDKPEDAVLASGQLKGITNIERQGIGYALNADTALQSGDVLETKKGAQAELRFQKNGSLILHENTEAELTNCQKEVCEIHVVQGELFGDLAQHSEEVSVTFAEHKAQLKEAVFAISAQSGSSTLNLFAGDISIVLKDGTQERVEAGEYLSVVEEEDSSLSYQIEKMQSAALNEFLIQQAMTCGSAENLCFAKADLQKVLDDREAEKQAALQAALNAEKITTEKTTEKQETQDPAEGGNAQNEEDVNTAAPAENTDNSGSVEEYTPEPSGSATSSAKVCTITIQCDTILKNMENLDSGKEAYVPSNGVILATSSVEFEDGETVFDVLNRVCEYAGIQIEYSWTPMYNSYYIEGINNLYEFDCGNESGWMYKVNGWFPNYGCSSYTLEDGDNIVWCYTCNGLGADVGAPMY